MSIVKTASATTGAPRAGVIVLWPAPIETDHAFHRLPKRDMLEQLGFMPPIAPIGVAVAVGRVIGAAPSRDLPQYRLR